jgi:hypothetical protein
VSCLLSFHVVCSLTLFSHYQGGFQHNPGIDRQPCRITSKTRKSERADHLSVKDRKRKTTMITSRNTDQDVVRRLPYSFSMCRSRRHQWVSSSKRFQLIVRLIRGAASVRNSATRRDRQVKHASRRTACARKLCSRLRYRYVTASVRGAIADSHS